MALIRHKFQRHANEQNIQISVQKKTRVGMVSSE